MSGLRLKQHSARVVGADGSPHTLIAASRLVHPAQQRRPAKRRRRLAACPSDPVSGG